MLPGQHGPAPRATRRPSWLANLLVILGIAITLWLSARQLRSAVAPPVPSVPSAMSAQSR